MNPLNQKLTVVAAALLLLSAATYWYDQSSADGFQRGQRLLQNLNPDEIAQIVLSKGGETLTLTRQGEGYIVEEKHGYRARNDAINRAVRDLLEIGLDREVGDSESLASELGIEPLGDESTEVTFSNASGQEMVRLRLGSETEGGEGTYVQRQDGEDRTIYLTAARVTLAAGAKDYLQREIVDHASGDVRRIEGADFVLARGEDGGSLELEQPAGRELKTSESSKLSSFLNRLRFEEVFLADDPQVATLPFAQALRIDLDDESGYIVSYAGADERHFVKLTGYFNVTQIELNQEDQDDELQDKADTLRRADEVQQFNAYHGSWVYELADFDGDKLTLRASDLTE